MSRVLCSAVRSCIRFFWRQSERRPAGEKGITSQHSACEFAGNHADSCLASKRRLALHDRGHGDAKRLRGCTGGATASDIRPVVCSGGSSLSVAISRRTRHRGVSGGLSDAAPSAGDGDGVSNSAGIGALELLRKRKKTRTNRMLEQERCVFCVFFLVRQGPVICAGGVEKAVYDSERGTPDTSGNGILLGEYTGYARTSRGSCSKAHYGKADG